MARASKLTGFATAFMLATAGMITAAPAADTTAQSQPAVKKTTKEQAHAQIAKIAGQDYREFVDSMRALYITIRGDRELTNYVISEFPNLIKTAKMQDHTPWNEVSIFLESLNEAYPGVYDDAVEASFKDFIANYIAETVGARGQEMDDRLYHIAVVSSRSKGLTALEVEKLSQVLSLNGDGTTWIRVLQTYQSINERNPGLYEEASSRALAQPFASLVPLLAIDNPQGRASIAYLVGNFAKAAPLLEDRVLQALAPLLNDDAVVTRKVIDTFYGTAEKNPAGAAKILSLLEPLADKATRLDPRVTSMLSYVIGRTGQTDPANLGDRAIDALEKISTAVPADEALGSIMLLGRENAAFAPRARAIMQNAAAQYDDVRAGEARRNLKNLAEAYKDSPEYVDAAVAALSEALEKNPLDYSSASQLSEIGMNFGGKTGEVIAILRPIFEAGTPLAQDERLMYNIGALGRQGKGPHVEEVKDLLNKAMIASAGKGDVDSVTNIAASLKSLNAFAERLQRPAPVRPLIPGLPR